MVADPEGARIFWVARFARIWPTYAFSFALALLILPFGSMMGQSHFAILGPLNLLLLQSWFFVRSVARNAS